MKKRNRKGLELTRSMSAVLLSIGMVLQPMVPAMSPLVTIHADPGNPGETPAPTETTPASTEPTPTQTPSASQTPVTPAVPSIADKDVIVDGNTLKVTVTGNIPEGASVVVNYTEATNGGNPSAEQQATLVKPEEGNQWTWTPAGSNYNSFAYAIKSINVVDAYGTSLLADGKALDVSQNNLAITIDQIKPSFSTGYSKGQLEGQPESANFNFANVKITNPAIGINDFSLAFYDGNTNVSSNYELKGTFDNNREGIVDISAFTKYIANNGTSTKKYQAKITYAGKEYSLGTELSIDHAPYVVDSSISPIDEKGNALPFNEINNADFTNKDVKISVTMSESLGVDTDPDSQKLQLNNVNNGNETQIITLTRDENYTSDTSECKYTGIISSEGPYNPNSFKLSGTDSFGQSIVPTNDAYKNFTGNKPFTIDKTVPVINSINVKNNNGKDINSGEFTNTKDANEKPQGITLTVKTSEDLKDNTLSVKWDGLNEAKPMTRNDDGSYSIVINGSGEYQKFVFTGTDNAGNEVKLDSSYKGYDDGSTVYQIDDDAPEVDLTKVKVLVDNKESNLEDKTNIVFGKNDIKYQINVKDSLSKLKKTGNTPEIKYFISTSDDSVLNTITDTDDQWVTATNIKEDGNDSYTVTIDAPKKASRIYLLTEDNAGNQAKTEVYKPVVVEHDLPNVSNIKVDNNNKKVKDNHKITLEASDDTTNDYSGIKSISFYLTEENKSVKIPLSNLVKLDDESKFNIAFNSDNTVTISRNDNPTKVSQLENYKTLSADITLNTADGNGTVLNGKYILHVTTTDYSANTSKDEKTSEVSFDTKAPEITVKMVNPAGKNPTDYYYNKNAKFTVNFDDGDGSGLDYAADKTKVTVSEKIDDTNTISVSVPYEQFKNGKEVEISKLRDSNNKSFVDGTISIEVKATDVAGNEQNSFKVENDVNYGLSIASTGEKDSNGNDISEGKFVYDITDPVARVTYAKPSRTEKDVVFFNALSTVKEAYVSVIDTNFDSSKISVKADDGSDATVVTDPTNYQYKKVFDKDGKYHLVISGTDKAGNRVIVEEEDINKSTEENKAFKTEVKSSDDQKDIKTVNEVVVDTVSPVVTISYNNPSSAAYAGTEHNLYYGNANKENQNVSFTFTDEHVGSYDLNEEKDLHIYQTKDNVEGTEDIGKQKTKNISLRNFADGTYSYSFGNSQDRAGNPIQVVQEYKVGETTTNLESANYNVVIDRTNPKVSIKVNDPHKEPNVDYKGRDYYGRKEDNINATFTVTEKNFDSDSDLIKFGYALNKVGRYAVSIVDWNKDLNSKLTGSNGTFTGTTGALSDEGVYKLEIEGHDKAMNPIVAADDQLTNPSEKPEDKEKLWTNEKVLDKSINAKLTVANPSDNEYFSVDFAKNSATAGNLYRNENTAVVTAKATDDERSPYKINYVLKSSLQDENISKSAGENYDYYEPLKYTIDGNQRFHVVSAYIEDMAGNVASIGEQTEIYLDTVGPHADDINKPVATIQARATSNITARTADGRALYGDQVKIDFNITDPNSNGKITSSGLRNIVYTVKADGVVVQQQTPAESNLNDPNLFNWHKEIVVDNDTNNIEVEFYGYDNAGNISNKVSYNFGIDLNGPTITVNYDNNDAQHDKYFKANRIATVTVQDRNIDFSKINIKTQVGHSDLSPAVANSTGNGNNDTRTFTIPYTQDGDYTLEITGTDAVNHPADVIYNGTAPRDFTIDKTIPVIKVSFDNNDVQNGKYYKAARTATINVNEHNFLGNEVKVDQTATIQRGTTSVPGVSGFSTGSDSHNATIRYNQDGNYTLTVNYTDMAGNQAAPVTVSEFTIDQTAPVVKIDGVKNNAAYNGEVMPTVTIDDTNFSEDLASFVLNGIKIKDRSNLLTSRVVNEFGATIRFENIAAVKDNDDVYTATAVVTDLAGNVTKTQVRFSVNRFGSTYDYGDSATKSLMTKYFDKKTGSVLINEINVNQLHDQKVYLNFNGGTEELEEGKDYKITVSQMEDGSGYKYTYEIFSSVFKKQGTYSITVQSVDEAGNINTNATVKEGNDVVDVPFEFAIDTTNPVITSTENLEPDVLWTKTHDAEHTFSFTTTDNMSISKLTYAVTDADGNPIGKEETLDADQLKAVNNMVSVDLRSANTNQYIKLTAVDAAGNTLTAMYSIYMNANALSRAWHFYWYVFLLVGAGIVILIFFLVRNSKNKKKAA